MEEPKPKEESIQIEEKKQAKEKKSKFNLLEWTTIIYAVLTFIGYLYIDSYYAHWGIRVYSFLDASEILLVLLNNINVTVITLIPFGFMVIWYMIYNQSKSTNNSQEKHPIVKYKLLFLFLFAFVMYGITTNDNSLRLFIIAIIGGIIFTGFLYFKMNNILKNSTLICYTYMVNTFLILSFLYFLIGSVAIFNYDKVINMKKQTVFSFTSESKDYQSNDSLLYIGATSKYIFIRNTKDSTNLIFDKANIKNLSLTEKRDTYKK